MKRRKKVDLAVSHRGVIVLVHRYDPKTDEKIGDSMCKKATAAALMGYPEGYKGNAGCEALKGNGPWEVRALGPGQKAGDNLGRGYFGHVTRTVHSTGQIGASGAGTRTE